MLHVSVVGIVVCKIELNFTLNCLHTDISIHSRLVYEKPDLDARLELCPPSTILGLCRKPRNGSLMYAYEVDFFFSLTHCLRRDVWCLM